MNTGKIYPLGCTAAPKVVEVEVEPLTFRQRVMRIALKPYVYHLCDRFSAEFTELITYVGNYHDMSCEIADALGRGYNESITIEYAAKRTRQLCNRFFAPNRRRRAIIKYMSLVEYCDCIRYAELLRGLEMWCIERSAYQLVEIIKGML